VYGALVDAPVKVISGDVEFLHTVIVPAIVAVGKGLIVTTALPVCGWEHAVGLPSCTLTRL
jgi:hypothetical protein